MQTSEDAMRASLRREALAQQLWNQKAETKAWLLAQRETAKCHSETASAAVEAHGVSATQYIKGAQRNGPCPCGSGKRFKHCCRIVRVQ